MDLPTRNTQRLPGSVRTGIEIFSEEGIEAAIGKSPSLQVLTFRDQDQGPPRTTPTHTTFPTETTSELEEHSYLLNGLGILALVISAGIIIAVIALVISKMRKKQNMKEADEDIEKRKSRSNSIDPYLQAIIFPTEHRPEWRNNLFQSLKNAGKRMSGKRDSTRTAIPDHLRHQLKHIYVY